MGNQHRIHLLGAVAGGLEVIHDVAQAGAEELGGTGIELPGSGAQRTIPLAPEPPEPGLGGLFSPPPDTNPLNKVGPTGEYDPQHFR